MEKLKKDLEKSGYSPIELRKIEERTIEREETQRRNSAEAQNTETLTFPLFYFKGYNEFKKIITDSNPALRQIIGETKIVMALKKNPSIGRPYTAKPEMQRNELSTMPVGEHLKQSIGKRQTYHFSKKHWTVSHAMWYTYGNANCVKKVIVTSGEQFKRLTNEQTLIVVVLAIQESGKIRHSQCMPKVVMGKMLIWKTFK